MNSFFSSTLSRSLPLAGCLALLFALLGFSEARAAVLAEYGFENTLAATNVASGITASDASLINGLSTDGSNGGYYPSTSPGGGSTQIQFNASKITSDDSIDGSAIKFTLTPDPAQTFGIVTWYMQALKVAAGGASKAYTGQTRLFVGTENFTSTLGSSALFSSTAPAGNSTEGGYTQGSFDLSSLGARSGKVEFRLVLIGGQAPTRAIGIDNIVVNAIPEPSTAGLLFGSLGVVLLFGRRRRIA